MGWDAWQWDAPTVAWTLWIAWFFGWEAWAVVTGQAIHTFTWHLRPALLAHPLLWFLALGLWLWLGAHLLAPALERSITKLG